MRALQEAYEAMQEFERLRADPNATPQQRVAALQRSRQSLQDWTTLRYPLTQLPPLPLTSEQTAE